MFSAARTTVCLKETDLSIHKPLVDYILVITSANNWEYNEFANVRNDSKFSIPIAFRLNETEWKVISE